MHGYIEGYRRVWWQQSTDHRGTPEASGTVVTLVPCPGARVWGVTGLLCESDDPSELAQVIADLDYREKQYDKRLELDVYGADGSILRQKCITYIGTAACENWWGERPLREIAATIAVAHGPSGSNDEYLCARGRARSQRAGRCDPAAAPADAGPLARTTAAVTVRTALAHPAAASQRCVACIHLRVCVLDCLAMTARRFRLCDAFRDEIGAEKAEPELFELETMVRELQAATAAFAQS
jgi:cation transport regulator ChaC